LIEFSRVLKVTGWRSKGWNRWNKDFMLFFFKHINIIYLMWAPKGLPPPPPRSGGSGWPRSGPAKINASKILIPRGLFSDVELLAKVILWKRKCRKIVCLIVLFHLLTSCHKRVKVRYNLEESAPAEKLSIFAFCGWFFDFLPLNLLLVEATSRDNHRKVPLIQSCNNLCDECGSWNIHENTIIYPVSMSHVLS